MTAPVIDTVALADQIGEHHAADDIAQAVIARISTWGPAYCQAIYPELGGLKAVVRLSDFVDFPENMLPAAVVVIPGTIGDTVKDSRGMYEATYSVLVGIVAFAQNEADTRRVCEQYGDIVRLTLIHNRKLAPDINTDDWLAETTDNMTVMETRRLLLCTNAFSVRCQNIGSWRQGPSSNVPPEDVGPWPTVTDTELTITRVS